MITIVYNCTYLSANSELNTQFQVESFDSYTEALDFMVEDTKYHSDPPFDKYCILSDGELDESFVAEFWNDVTQQAVKLAEENVKLVTLWQWTEEVNDD